MAKEKPRDLEPRRLSASMAIAAVKLDYRGALGVVVAEVFGRPGGDGHRWLRSTNFGGLAHWSLQPSRTTCRGSANTSRRWPLVRYELAMGHTVAGTLKTLPRETLDSGTESDTGKSASKGGEKGFFSTDSDTGLSTDSDTGVLFLTAAFASRAAAPRLPNSRARRSAAASLAALARASASSLVRMAFQPSSRRQSDPAWR
jgi:hypothetical protein